MLTVPFIHRFSNHTCLLPKKKKDHSVKAFAALTEEEKIEQNKKRRDTKKHGTKDAIEPNANPPTFPPPPLANELAETII